MCFLALLSGRFCWVAVLIFVAVALSGSWASMVAVGVPGKGCFCESVGGTKEWRCARKEGKESPQERAGGAGSSGSGGGVGGDAPKVRVRQE